MLSLNTNNIYKTKVRKSCPSYFLPCPILGLAPRERYLDC